MKENIVSLSSSPVATLLLSWYDQNRRPLPWRENPDPYHIWVSEIMLQQTRMTAALPYFDRFIKRLPDIRTLAEAEENVLLKLWEGLGYYSRVKNMQKAAQVIVAEHGGRLPMSYDLLVKLPGIGEYTAGAIASTAFGIPVTAVDGNVLRVMSRLTGSFEDITKSQVKKVFQQAVKELQSKERPGDFNQAMMELGALVCLPNGAPLCRNCPLTAYCVGFQKDIAGELPVKSSLKSRTIEHKTVLMILSKNAVLLHKRPDTGLLAGLWEFPNIDETAEEQDIKNKLKAWNITPVSIQKTQPSSHIFTHKEWLMTGFLVYAEQAVPIANHVWVESEELTRD
ncbi:MAG: A/G-specific adenine glycosylase, partial [Clostridiales bacterium 43-6]